MRNEYIESLYGELQDGKCISRGANYLTWAYRNSIQNGFNVLVVDRVPFGKQAEEFLVELKASGISEVYVVDDASNKLDIYLWFDENGLKLRGIVRLENAAYYKELERYKESDRSPTLPALKFSFEE